MKLIQPTYFSPISQYAVIYGEQEVLFECEDNYQKQTYRNRCYIGGANGKQLLNIPIKHGKTSRKTKDIEIDYTTPLWYKNHLKSLQAAYRSSPFYEYYEQDIINIYEKEHKYLVDLNLDIHVFVMNALQESTHFSKTKEYQTDNSLGDYRILTNAKVKNEWNLPSYIQMFDEKHGFLENLSILDLLFMEGPASYKYLQSISNLII